MKSLVVLSVLCFSFLGDCKIIVEKQTKDELIFSFKGNKVVYRNSVLMKHEYIILDDFVFVQGRTNSFPTFSQFHNLYYVSERCEMENIRYSNVKISNGKAERVSKELYKTKIQNGELHIDSAGVTLERLSSKNIKEKLKKYFYVNE